MTRKEYLQNEVEKLCNEVIIPILNKNIIEERVKKLNKDMFFYGVGRLSPLQILMRITRVLTDEEYEEVMEHFKKEGYL